MCVLNKQDASDLEVSVIQSTVVARGPSPVEKLTQV